MISDCLGDFIGIRKQETVVQVACHALTRTNEQYSPVGTETLPIAAVVISRIFADLINSLSSAAASSISSTGRSNNAVIDWSGPVGIEKCAKLNPASRATFPRPVNG